MKRLGWISLSICLTAFEVWAVLGTPGHVGFDNHPFLFPLIIATFTVSGLGGWWMLFRIVRHEKRVFPMILVPLLVPNSFLWYYFERIAQQRWEQPAT
ncbi:MAG TPA: hypothetical protein VJO53_08215 [Candidatus Acidoferrales bacterium]|nr:hypothetical protein [Candidatus Acidoferrales bacterium]